MTFCRSNFGAKLQAKPSAVFVFARFCYLKRKEFVIILFCGLAHVFCAEYCTYVLHVPFIELSLALNILL